ncbi:protein TRACHEARY ELEMENT DIFFERENTIATION-RELATED 7A-like [Carya illinoinensis]|uniref:Uncharacterized protein n=1 Tax=Carya illinoinensis TaxID=32201 RepID=A0A8T1RPV7_CARIL|nr:protein TRACHEARY ELEMENT DIFFERENTIATION-RELATED 7A-like [Carya illinoinensis]KAG6668759.1 hypothetical protein CIPAW_01G193700 [Carya illinoinensis]
MSATLFAISSNLMKRTFSICSFNLAAAKSPPFLLSYIAISPKKPVRLFVPSLADEPASKSPPEFPKVPNHQPSVPPEVPPVPTTPKIDPGSIQAEVNTNPPGTKPGPEFPRTPIPPHPDPGPELPKPTILPRPDPDIPLPKPDVVPPYPPDYVPPNPSGPDIVPPPPPTGPYILEEVLRRGVGLKCIEFELVDV